MARRCDGLVARGALSGLHEPGVAVPDRVSIAGFDDIPFAGYATPPPTTASVRLAVRRGTGRPNGQKADTAMNSRPGNRDTG
ncbi:substrate-binding domain-containing protein [Saccharothrix sp. BKS2]|uniref:substrate-binding domain-containing protein n=1 Tax=Saccharothrix sp. BKS2 TaxID=3064400 RepID=UPI0039E9225D